jgi:hypothetical protein
MFIPGAAGIAQEATGLGLFSTCRKIESKVSGQFTVMTLGRIYIQFIIKSRRRKNNRTQQPASET